MQSKLKRLDTEQFLMDYWKSDDTVKVNAVELQGLLRAMGELQLENKRLKKRIEVLELLKKDVDEQEELPYVRLDIKV